ncbi:MAG: flagellar biosynthesis protein FlhA [Sulfuricellaceae bacterium]
MSTQANALAFVGGLNLGRMAGPVLVILILGMMILPLPPLLLDLLFTFNIALSMIVLLVSLYTQKPLEFAVFPTVLLVTTLLRLSLNVASARIVLMEGHTGPGAAGKVIEAFGHFLVGGNYTVGIVVFIILVVINFVVITKGAGRIAEVGARFALDAMPGKQMAIDADLNAGLIGEEEAKLRRATVSQEADFYGSMDGASKFVRGDAIAGILIMLINIIGGLAVGILQHDLDFATAANNYTLLTVGDGLVAQIPALVISTAAGIVVSRVSTDQNLSEQMIGQLLNRPQVLALTGGILGMLGMIPGMPHFAFITLAGMLGGSAYLINQRQRAPLVRPEVAAAAAAAAAQRQPDAVEVGWDDVLPVDVLGLEVGYRLIPLVDRVQDGELLRRIKGIRKKFAQEMGFLVPSVHIRDNLELRPNSYRITLKGVEIGQGEAFAGMYLAINPGRVMGELDGTPTRDPAFGLPAVWIDTERREQAQNFGYTVVDASTVVATHLSNIIQSHAAELLGREEVQQLLDHLSKESPKLTEDLVPKQLSLGGLQRVLQSLLEEEVHIRDMRTIIETLSDHITRTQNVEELTAAVRVALGRAIIQQIYPGSEDMQVITLDPRLENVLMQATQTQGGEGAGLEPGLAENLLRQVDAVVQQQEQLGLPTVLLVPAPLRILLARFLRRAAPQLKVISHAEVPDSKNVRVTAVLGNQ